LAVERSIVKTLTSPQVADMLHVIRMKNGGPNSVEDLRAVMDVSRSTADKLFNILLGKEYGIPIIEKKGQNLYICKETGLFLGVSIGSKYIRVALIGLDLTPIQLKKYFSIEEAKRINYFYEEDYSEYSYTFKIDENKKNKLEMVRTVVRGVISYFLDRVSHSENDTEFHLLGIGFSVTGPVDYENQIWKSAPRLTQLQSISLGDLIGYGIKKRIEDMGLFVSFDNNAKAAAVSEYEYLMQKTSGQYSEDLSVIYVGSGVGLASVIDGKLFRGGGNISELGHVQMVINDNPGNIVTKSIEQLLKVDPNTNPDKSQKVEYYRIYLPYVLNIVNCMTGTKKFILVGHNVTMNDELMNQIMDQRIKFTVDEINASMSAEIGRQLPYTSAIGAAIETYFTLINYRWEDGNQERTNLAKEISWRKLP